MYEELIEKCKLNLQELEAAARKGQSSVPSYGSGAAEHRSAEIRAIQGDLLLKAIPIIQKVERERISDIVKMPYGQAGNQVSTNSVALFRREILRRI